VEGVGSKTTLLAEQRGTAACGAASQWRRGRAVGELPLLFRGPEPRLILGRPTTERAVRWPASSAANAARKFVILTLVASTGCLAAASAVMRTLR
jgi:hypothetical protein